jgi:hypothetical protein
MFDMFFLETTIVRIYNFLLSTPVVARSDGEINLVLL